MTIPDPTAPDRSAQAMDAGQGATAVGAMVLVVGSSGAGKDTLLRRARAALADEPGVQFPRRHITRGPDPHEDHLPIDEADYAELCAQGGAALAWRAHGLGYAIPASIDAEIRRGAVVVANVSRQAIAEARQRFDRVVVVVVTAPAEVLAARLAARGREAAADVSGRLSRSLPGTDDLAGAIVIENVGDPAAGAARLAEVIRALLPGVSPAAS